MKLRISGKDFLMFVIFAIFLLYLCAILTSNISSFGETGVFSGLNPIPGLTEYLGATIILFVILLVLIFTSVSSYVFERKKGVGFEISEKEEKGYSRWAKDSEIKNDKDVVKVNPLDQETTAAGIPLVNDGKNLWVDNGEYHNLVIGSTGSGKSQTVVEPMVELLIKKGESMIITDPKGELYTASADYMRERGYNVVVLNFRDPQRGNAWNPLTLPYQYYSEGNSDKATELLEDVASNILYDPNNKSGDPFWEKSAADYFSGLTLGLFQDADLSEINLNSISYMSTVGEEKMGANTYIKEYFTLKGEASNAYVFASNTINAPSETKGGILSVFRQKIRQFASRENLSEMLSHSDFDMRDIGKEKTAVFIVVHDEKTTYHSLATIFIKQCYETLIDVAQQNGGKLPYRTNFILDEFANMPPLRDVTTMVTAARSRTIRFTFIIQNFAQLKSVYGAEDAETIKGNCGNLVYLISTELAALEEISKMCGEVKSKQDDKTASTPLVTVTDLQKLKLFQAIIIRWRLSPYKVKYTPNFKMDWGHPKSEAKFPQRDKEEIKVFDVKEFTKTKKGEKIKNSLNERKSPGMSGSANPFMGSNPFNRNGFSSSNPFLMNNNDTEDDLDDNLFGGKIDLDKMMADIDKKIAELDAEEARQKEEEKKKESITKEEKETEDKSIKEKIEDKKEVEKEDKKVSGTHNLLQDNLDKLFDDDDDDFDDLEEDDPISNKLEEETERVKDAKVEELDSTNNTDFNNYLSSSEKPKVAVAFSSPANEEYLDDDIDLPKVENTTILTPSTNGKITRTESNNYQKNNLFKVDTSDIKRANEIKEETKDFINSIETSKDQIDKEYEKLEEEQKTNVNLNPDEVEINDNMVTDDEFFDDFFADD